MYSFLNATMLQVVLVTCNNFRYDDGPMALGSILAKSFVTKILVKFSYRRTLFAITIIIGLMIAQFSLQSPDMSIYLVIPLFY